MVVSHNFMKKLLGILVLSLLWCNVGVADDKKIEFKLDVSSSVGQKHIWIFYEDNTCGEEGSSADSCTWVEDGNKVIWNVNRGHYIVNANISFLGKVKGTWQSISKDHPTGTIWGKKID